MQLSLDGFMLESMNELDEVWSQTLNDALIKAQSAERGDVADYIALRTTNDNLRRTSIKWLFDSLIEIASYANRSGSAVTIETKNQHQFKVGNSTLSGASIALRQGVRCLTVEAGWTRLPADGFMRGGALAIGRLVHFGISKHNIEIFLISENNAPSWFTKDKNGKREAFDARHLNEHFQIFLGSI